MGSVTLSPELDAILGALPILKSEVENVANQILESASATAPVLTGALRDSGRVEMGIDTLGRIEARVIFGGGEAPYAEYVEFGTFDTPINAFLRRGAELAGYQPG
jgi:uncharacterized protein (DUF1501 family)